MFDSPSIPNFVELRNPTTCIPTEMLWSRKYEQMTLADGSSWQQRLLVRHVFQLIILPTNLLITDTYPTWSNKNNFSDIYGEIGVSAPFTVTKSDHSACYVDNLNVHVRYYFVWSYLCLGLPWTLFVSEKPQIALQVNHCLCYCVWQGRKSPPWQVRTLGCEAYPMVATNINPKFVGGNTSTLFMWLFYSKYQFSC